MARNLKNLIGIFYDESCLLKIIYLFRTSRASGHSLLIFESSADKNIENYPTIDSRKEVERLQVEMFLKGTLSNSAHMYAEGTKASDSCSSLHKVGSLHHAAVSTGAGPHLH